MSIDEVAGELYVLRPTEFTAARKAEVAAARNSGDKDLASQIGALRRPTVSAWIVNLIARERPELMEDLLAVGDELRQAQEARSGADLRRLSARRRDLVSTLVQDGRRLATERGRPPNAQVADEVTATLQAGLADAHAAAALRSGRLTSALEYSGFGTISPAVAAGQGGHKKQLRSQQEQARSTPSVASLTGPARHPSDQAAATKALDSAQTRLAELEQAAAQAEQAVSAMIQRRQEAAHRVKELEQELARSREDERESIRGLRSLDKDRDRAGRAVRAGQRRVAQAQAALDAD